MIRAGIIGSTGYAGQELVRILLGHKDVEIKWYGSRSYIDQAYASVFQNMFQLVPDICKGEDLEQLCEEVDVVFTATPQGLCSSLVSENVLSKVKVIDLSADFRIKDVKKYEKWYGIEHKSPQFIDEAVYGLCEINREDIKNHVIVHTFCIYQLKKVLINSCIFFINVASGSIPCYFHIFMSQKETYNFISRITGCSNNSSFYHFSVLHYYGVKSMLFQTGSRTHTCYSVHWQQCPFCERSEQ